MALPVRSVPKALSPRLLRPGVLKPTTTWQARQIATAAAVEPVEAPPYLPYDIPLPRSGRAAAIREAKPFSDFLTDTHARQHDYLRISLTERCNLRCLYCMPEEGIDLSPNRDLLTTAEIVYLSALFVNQGVTKIRLTGGEPTVRKDIVPLMHQIGALRKDGLKELALTTNGISLHRKLDEMLKAGLTGVNISLDTLDPFQFQLLTRRQGFAAVMKSIDRVKEMNRLGAGIKLKINCVVMRGLTDHQILPFVEMTENEEVEVRFIEYMPFGGNKWSQNKMVSYADMLDIIRAKYPEFERLKDRKSDTSKTWQVPGFVGKVGFITSMTQDFCGSCNRLRITSDGNLKVCLHGEAEVSLRDVLRNNNAGNPMDGEAFEAVREIEMARTTSTGAPGGDSWMSKERELLELIGAAVKRKKESHADMGDLENMKNRPMILIGGPDALFIDNKMGSVSSRLGKEAVDSIRPVSGANNKLPLRVPAPERIVGPPARSVEAATARPGSAPTAYALPDGKKSMNKLLRRANGKRLDGRERRAVYRRIERIGSPKHSGVLRSAELEGDRKPNPFTQELQSAVRSGVEIADAGDNAWGFSLDDLSTIDSFTDPNTQSASQSNPSPTGRYSRPSASSASSPLTPPPDLTHLTSTGEAHMVSVSAKPATNRTAIALSTIHLASPQTYNLLITHSAKKGDVLATARIAGIMAAKRTSELIPLCHPLLISKVEVLLTPLPPGTRSGLMERNERGVVVVQARVDCTGPTGVEMEALTAVSVAGLTVYDMLKAVDRGMRVEETRVVYKSGGKSGVFVDEEWLEENGAGYLREQGLVLPER
ncbi:hypothetical protein B0A48_10013 [Cryoendolithus antarcticus]|uniref:Radical SAM core domain-containing protein n=1 Tax=Cryoendolithus antarcticus TaxID=1507870 RepID=A0A1V8T3C6_9PEZI|nr:hypothetical protein B0A48_10013 [Cryoendolithus antarcticus]